MTSCGSSLLILSIKKPSSPVPSSAHNSSHLQKPPPPSSSPLLSAEPVGVCQSQPLQRTALIWAFICAERRVQRQERQSVRRNRQNEKKKLKGEEGAEGTTKRGRAREVSIAGQYTFIIDLTEGRVTERRVCRKNQPKRLFVRVHSLCVCECVCVYGCV